VSGVEIMRFAPADQAGVFNVILSIQREEFAIAITAAEQTDIAAIADFYQTARVTFGWRRQRAKSSARSA
jgi:hypothetical protein